MTDPRKHYDYETEGTEGRVRDRPLTPAHLAAVVPAVLVLLLDLAASMAPGAVEAWYAGWIHPVIAAALAAVTGPVPFSVIEILAVTGLLLTAYLVGSVLRSVWRGLRSPGNAALHGLAKLLSAAAVLYVGFVLLWGLNYHRPPMAQRAGLEVGGIEASELEVLAADLASRANDLRTLCAEDERGVMRLERGREGTLAVAHLGWDTASEVDPGLRGPDPRIKVPLLSPVLASLGVSGIYSPWTGEVHVVGDVPDALLPYLAAHETAHLRGVADEAEASYAGYLACRFHGDEDFVYSALLVASTRAVGALRATDPEAARAVEAIRSSAVRRDLRAIAAWRASRESPLRGIGRAANDLYLRSRGEEGIASYGRWVELLVAEWRRWGAVGPSPSP